MAIKITLHKYLCELCELLNMSLLDLMTMEIGNPPFLNRDKLESKSHSEHDAILSYFSSLIYSVAQGLSSLCGTMLELKNPVGSYLS